MPRDYGNAEGLWVGIMLNEHAKGTEGRMMCFIIWSLSEAL